MQYIFFLIAGSLKVMKSFRIIWIAKFARAEKLKYLNQQICPKSKNQQNWNKKQHMLMRTIWDRTTACHVYIKHPSYLWCYPTTTWLQSKCVIKIRIPVFRKKTDLYIITKLEIPLQNAVAYYKNGFTNVYSKGPKPLS